LAISTSFTENEVKNRVLPDCYIYISHLDGIAPQYWRLPQYPDEVADQMQSNFSDQNALGRSAPVYTFSSAGPRTVQFNLEFHRDMIDEANVGYSNVMLNDNEDYSDKLIAALQAIAVPKYNLTNKAIEPPLVAIRLGRQVFIKGVVTSGIAVTYRKPILSNEKYAVVGLSFTVSEVDPYDATTVYTNGSFRGLVSSMRKGMGLEENGGGGSAPATAQGGPSVQVTQGLY
jgi:hypothetical protein